MRKRRYRACDLAPALLGYRPQWRPVDWPDADKLAAKVSAGPQVRQPTMSRPLRPGERRERWG